jgi:hypothetical protein
MNLADFYLIVIAVIFGVCLIAAVHYGRPLMGVMVIGIICIMVTAPCEVGFGLLALMGLVVYAWVRFYGWKLP